MKVRDWSWRRLFKALILSMLCERCVKIYGTKDNKVSTSLHAQFLFHLPKLASINAWHDLKRQKWMPIVDKGMHWCGPTTSKIKHFYENDVSSVFLCSYFGYIIICFCIFVYLCWCLFDCFNCCNFLVICHFLLENESCKINSFSWFFVFFSHSMNVPNYNLCAYQLWFFLMQAYKPCCYVPRHIFISLQTNVVRDNQHK
jgi:hypothetical protein